MGEGSERLGEDPGQRRRETEKCMTSLAKAVRVEEGASVPHASMLALPSFTDVMKACTSFPPR